MQCSDLCSLTRGSGGQPRKLPILLEEEDAEGEAMKIPERCSPVSSCSRASTPAPTPHQTDLKGSAPFVLDSTY